MDQDVINIWLQKQGYSGERLCKVSQKLQRMDKRLLEALSSVMDEISPEMEIEGISYDYLVRILKLKPANALITLDWLCREPIVAKKAIKEGAA